MTGIDRRNTADWGRLADAVRQRRADLRMTQGDVQVAGGPSSAKVREIENRRTVTLSPSKRRDLERALRWEEGSVDEILAGGEAFELPDPDEVRVSSALRHPSGKFGLGEQRASNLEDNVARLLRKIAGGGADPADKVEAARYLEDIDIERFPALFNQLNRDGKLRVVRFGQRVLQEESAESAERRSSAPAPEADDLSPAPGSADPGDRQSDFDLARHRTRDPRFAPQDDGGVGIGEAPDPEGPEDGA